MFWFPVQLSMQYGQGRIISFLFDDMFVVRGHNHQILYNACSESMSVYDDNAPSNIIKHRPRLPC